MHRHFVVLLVALIASACGSGSSDVSVDDAAVASDDAASADMNAAMNADAPAAENEDIAAFFARFKSTVRANDAEAVASMAEFPFEMGGIGRDAFLTEFYPSILGEGEFRDRLLAGSPAAIREEGEGRYSFSALVTGCGDMEMEEEFDCESVAVFYFGQNAEGHWRLVDVMLAG